MNAFIEVVTSFPAVIYTVLLAVAVLYWILAMVGLVDFESGSFDLESDLEGGIGDVGTLASYVVGFGLSGVPISIVVSLLLLFSWTITSVATQFVLPLVPTPLFRAIVGGAVLVGAFAASIPVTAWLIRPMRRLFVTHSARSNASLVGQMCKVLTLTVDEKFGRAEVSDCGASFNIRIRADVPNTLSKGSSARIIAYDEATSCYQVVSEEN